MPFAANTVYRVMCQITFKFGNSGTLQSEYALAVPIGPLHLKVAVVPGETPFLISNTFMRAILPQIDCQIRVVTSPLLIRSISLQLTRSFVSPGPEPTCTGRQ